jgi:hypothetical protein
MYQGATRSLSSDRLSLEFGWSFNSRRQSVAQHYPNALASLIRSIDDSHLA